MGLRLMTQENNNQEPTTVAVLFEGLKTLMELGYSDMPVYFDTECQSYDVHFVPIGPISWDESTTDMSGNDMLVLAEASPFIHRC